MVVTQRLLHGILPHILIVQLLCPGSQLDKQKIEGGVIDDIVILPSQIAVYILQQSADAFQRQGVFQHIDVNDPAQLIQRIVLTLRGRQKTTLDPILNGIGLQTRNFGDLTEYHASSQEHRGKHLLHAIGILLTDKELRTGDSPFQRKHLLVLWCKDHITQSYDCQ